MFLEEANWVKQCLSGLHPREYYKAGNLGSSTEHFRKIIQPHIHKNIIEPLQQNEWHLVNIDLKKEEGVDIVADVSDKDFGKQFYRQFGLTICTNMLEHVSNIPIVIQNLLSIAAPSGYILITVPYRYRIHHDPIDNGFRPTPEEIYHLFPAGTVQIITQSILSISDKNYYRIKRSHIPLWSYRERIMYYFGRRYKVSGILLQRMN